MKSNSKQVREQIKKHILECVYNEQGEQFTDLKTACNYLKNEFIRVANYPYNLQKFPNDQNRFSDYLFGLPFHFYFSNEDIKNYINSLGLNPEGKNYSSDKTIKLYHYLVFSEINKNL